MSVADDVEDADIRTLWQLERMVCQRFAVNPAAAFSEAAYPDVALRVLAGSEDGSREVLLEVLDHLEVLVLYVESVAVGTRPAPALRVACHTGDTGGTQHVAHP